MSNNNDRTDPIDSDNVEVDPFADVEMDGRRDEEQNFAGPDVSDATVRENDDDEPPAQKSGKAPLYAGMAVAGLAVMFIVYSAVAPLLGGGKKAPSSVTEIEVKREVAPEPAKVVDTPATPVEVASVAGPAPVMVAGKEDPLAAAPTVSPSFPDAKPAPSVPDDELRVTLITIRESLASMDVRMKALEKKAEQAPRVGQVIPNPMSAGNRVSDMALPSAPTRSRADRLREEREAQESARMESRSQDKGSPIFGYYVQAIYPTEGDFKKAWVANGERTHIVTVGDTFNGVKVTRIDGKSMSVRTDAGSIRSRN